MVCYVRRKACKLDVSFCNLLRYLLLTNHTIIITVFEEQYNQFYFVFVWYEKPFTKITRKKLIMKICVEFDIILTFHLLSMRSISRLARLQTRSSSLTVPSPVENRICYQDNRPCSRQNTTVSRPPYRSFVSGFSGRTSIPECEQKSVRVAIIGSPNVGSYCLYLDLTSTNILSNCFVGDFCTL